MQSVTSVTSLTEQYLVVDRRTGNTFTKGKLLGKGGFASVYEVTDLRSNLTFADKVISKELARKRSSHEKIRREIELHRRLVHPNVVRFVDTFDDDRSIHMILEFCALKSLLHLMKRRKTLNEDEVRYFLRQICDGVRYIHQNGIVHRDLKLGNMFLTSALVVKIGDFGLATAVSAATAAGSLCGTPNYIAPEVLQKRGHGFEADIWAIGCMTFAMMSGNPPFETKSLSTTYAKITSNSYTLPPNLSRSAKNLITMMLHPNPSSRGCLHLPEHPLHIVNQEFFRSVSEESSTTSSSSNTSSSSPTNSSLKTSLRDKISNIFSSQSMKDLRSHNWSNSSTTSNNNNNKFLHSLLSKLSLIISTRTSFHTCQSNATKPPVISKWIDYSNKYGFGYQSSTGTVGVLFNDGFRASRRLVCDHTGDFEVVDDRGSIQTFDLRLPIPDQYAHYAKILEHFARYMEDNLADSNWSQQNPHTHGKQGQVLDWSRNDSSVLMLLDNRSLQINFFATHEKVLFWEGQTHGEIGVTFLNHGITITLKEAEVAKQRPLPKRLLSVLINSMPEIKDFSRKRRPSFA